MERVTETAEVGTRGTRDNAAVLDSNLDVVRISIHKLRLGVTGECLAKDKAVGSQETVDLTGRSCEAGNRRDRGRNELNEG